MQALEEYATEAMDIRNTLTEKLAGLSPEDYMGILRPAFQQDEWKLIVAGGVGVAGNIYGGDIYKNNVIVLNANDNIDGGSY